MGCGERMLRGQQRLTTAIMTTSADPAHRSRSRSSPPTTRMQSSLPLAGPTSRQPASTNCTRSSTDPLCEPHLRRVLVFAPGVGSRPMYHRTMALVEVASVSKSYPRRSGLRTEMQTVVEDVSLSIESGETLGLVGESGSGKT